MGNNFRISVRLKSDLFDFETLIPSKMDYKFVYNKKGNSVIKQNEDRLFRARANILIVQDVHITEKIEDSFCVFLNKLSCLMDLLSVINTDDIKREVYISAAIENQQFGFSINLEFLNLLIKNNYSLSFSGILYL
jgi:hypothetical protein